MVARQAHNLKVGGSSPLGATRSITKIYMSIPGVCLYCRAFLKTMTTQTFNTIYKNHAAKMICYAGRILNSKQAAEDIVHDVFVALWQKEDSDFRNQVTLNVWLFTSVKNACINLRKRENKITDLDECFALITRINAAAELREWVMNINPTKCRETLQMFLDGYSINEIEKIHSVSRSTVLNQRSRGIYLIRKFLGINRSLIF